MGTDEKKKEEEKKRKPYRKPELTMEELFEATVLACGKTSPATLQCQGHISSQ